MHYIAKTFIAGVILIVLSSCGDGKSGGPEKAAVLEPGDTQGDDGANASSKPLELLPKDSFATVAWTDLLPKDDLDALLAPPEYIADIADGSEEDQISSNLQNAIAAASDDRYQQALVSTRVVPEFDGKPIRIPGFIVPLEFSSEQVTTEFFLVPFFGACLHMPPPPPNQIIFVEYPQGFKLESLYEAFWVSGVLQSSVVANETATAAYSMELQYIDEYIE